MVRHPEMISFNLICQNAHEFEGWFQNSADYDKQSKKHLIECPVCGDVKVEKAVMAPAIGAKSEVRADRADKAERAKKLAKMLGEVRDYVETNFDDVGDDFPEEARKIYYGESEERGIYGNATEDEAAELAEEGVPVGRLPWAKRPNG